MIPASELKVVNDAATKAISKFSTSTIGKEKPEVSTIFDLPNPEETPSSALVDKLEDINQTLIILTKVINK